MLNRLTGSPDQTRPQMCIDMTSSWWAKIWHLIFFQVLVCTGWYWICRGLVLGLVLGGTGSVIGGTDWYLVWLGQYEAVLVSTWLYLVSRRRHKFFTWCYLVSIGRHWSVLGGTWSEQISKKVILVDEYMYQLCNVWVWFWHSVLTQAVAWGLLWQKGKRLRLDWTSKTDQQRDDIIYKNNLKYYLQFRRQLLTRTYHQRKLVLFSSLSGRSLPFVVS